MEKRPRSRYSRKHGKDGISVDYAIQRGKVALAEAEDHIRVFEEYLQASLGHVEESEKDKTLDVGVEDKYWDAAEEKINSGCTLDEILETMDPIVNILAKEENDFDQKEEIIKKDILHSKTFQTNRDNIIDSSIDRLHFAPMGLKEARLLLRIDKKQPNKRKAIREFDPSRLSVNQRAIRKDMLKKPICDVSEGLKQFKARPLPGGVFVRNDLYALTKAAEGKMSNKKIDSSRDDVSIKSCQNRLDASVLLNNSSMNMPMKDVKMDDSNDHVQNGVKRYKLSKEIYDATTTVIEQDFEDDSSSFCTIQEDNDVSDLHKQISKLHAELQLKKKQCIRTIHAIEDETKCRTISETKIDKFQQGENASVDTTMDDATSVYSLNCSSIGSASRKSLYKRQKEWLENLERKKIEQRASNQSQVLIEVTGRPDLRLAKRSWSNAKMEHDGILEISKKKDEQIQREKNEKERQNRLKQVKEAEEIKRVATEQAKVAKKSIDRRVQSEYVDKLSRPNKRVESKHVPTEQDNNFTQKNSQTKEKSHEKNNFSTISDERREETRPTTPAQPSFADMDDDEFARMIKKVQARAKKELRRSTIVKQPKRRLSKDEKAKKRDGSIAKGNLCNSPFRT